MILSDPYFAPVKSQIEKPPLETYVEWCKEQQPPSLFCELPEELRFRAISSAGTVQTYSVSLLSGATGAVGTTTTTTLER